MYECDINLVLYIWFVIQKNCFIFQFSLKFQVLYLLYCSYSDLYYLFYLNVLKFRLKKQLMEDQEVLDSYGSKNKNLKYDPY